MSYQRRQTLRELDSPQFKSARADLSRLELARPEEFCFLTQSNCITLPNVSDAEKFHEMEFACIRLGLTKPELEDAFSVCGAILHLGNLEFIDNTDGNGGCVLKEVSSVTSALENASRLMGLSEEEVSLRLRSRELVVRGEVNVVQLNKTQAGEARDALCKVMYKNCFDWLVERTNIAMIDPHATPEAIANERGRYHKPPTSSRKFIGILDIFGFEIFELNGFEQLCINYANEKLQQHFNQHTFKDELAACERENIPFENFTFSDNAVRLCDT
ncbi:myoI [Symbiodinium microadriaticum]|nr:myoI [Symbiodinium microadriaticum]